MNAYDRLPEAVTELFGGEATAERSYDLLTVDVPAASWTAALETARDTLGCTYFDWLSAVDEPDTGFRICAHVVALQDRTVRRLLVRTTVPHDAPVLPSAIGVYAGASWHERETHEMFGVSFTDHPHLVPLLLPEDFEGYPLRKDFVLAARVVKAWPGAKEPGESEHGGPRRRQMQPPGVPDPNEWGPQKGLIPAAPARPARTPRAAGDRPARRDRSVSEGSTSQTPETPAGPPPESAPWRKRTSGPGQPPADSTPDQHPDSAAAGAGTGPARDAEPGAAAGTEPGAAAGTDSRPGPAPEAEPGADAEAGTKSGAEPDAKPDAEPGTEVRPERGAKPDAEPGPDTPAGGDTA